MSNNLTLGYKLASLRGHYRKTQKEVSSETGITQELFSKYENDKEIPKLTNLKKLANAYYTTIEGIENYAPSDKYVNTFNDNAKGFFNVGKVILSNIEEIILDTLEKKPLEKGKELKITVSFKIE